MKVLIIDDSSMALTLAKARLAREHLEILCAGGGREGLDIAQRELPDLILLDLDMPDMSGFDVCRALKADSALRMIPVIFLSGSAGLADKVMGLDLGAVDYVTKPFDGVELRARVRAALRTKYLQDLLIKHTQIDPLTGLGNRRALQDRLLQEWARVQRYGGVFAVIMADLDHFKAVNDTYGHPAGDRVLQEVAEVLAAQCRDSDVLIRYGGEEFSLILPTHHAQEAAVLAERCRLAIANLSVDTAGTTIRLSASFGVADSAGCASADEIIEQADKALYRAKQSGRNRVEITAPVPASPA